MPWATPASSWYHESPQFPIGALTEASQKQEYTLTDRGTLLTLQSQNATAAKDIQVYKAGADTDPNDPLLNPAAALWGGKVCEENQAIAQSFVAVLPGLLCSGSIARAVYRTGSTSETSDLTLSARLSSFWRWHVHRSPIDSQSALSECLFTPYHNVLDLICYQPRNVESSS